VLHEAGADVVLCARRVGRLKDLAAELGLQRQKAWPEASSGGAFVVEMDVADPVAVPKGFDAVEACLNGRTCDIVLNCAGIAIPKLTVETSDEDYEALMAVNQRGAFYVAREAARRMIRAKLPGSIINIGSILGLRQEKAQATYGMSKAAMIQMTKIMALELASNNIRVNCIAPGYFRTEINEEFFDSEKGKAFVKRIPMRRLGQASELDAVTLTLASEKAGSFITGACIVVDGGHTLSAL